MSTRLSFRAMAFFLALSALFALTFIDAGHLSAVRAPALKESRALVARLGLTDLSLFTEARYTRHPSQADLHSAFQDHPVSLEHFPTGTMAGPPAHLRRLNGKLD